MGLRGEWARKKLNSTPDVASWRQMDLWKTCPTSRKDQGPDAIRGQTCWHGCHSQLLSLPLKITTLPLLTPLITFACLWHFHKWNHLNGILMSCLFYFTFYLWVLFRWLHVPVVHLFSLLEFSIIGICYNWSFHDTIDGQVGICQFEAIIYEWCCAKCFCVLSSDANICVRFCCIYP